ncbi:hypothetical protein A6770_36865 [Nostoc minutum NIES-26]|uniref:CHAT domain-containing protein n=1 Tax=Nostoc minutum NIES-26 TaxID=1844469 RepID=A0A367RYZ4_9NOSO|nr:hypothetical protein A6770_36865 [Nostoc minutum NIES-26]
MVATRHWSKYLLLNVLGVCIVVIQPSFIPTQAVEKEAQRTQAKLLTEKGHELLDRGRNSEAFEAWKQATKIYRKLQYEQGITGSLINESLALQALGLYPRACNTLLQALKLDKDSSICDTSLEQATDSESTTASLKAAIDKQKLTQVDLLGLQNLGDVLRLIGKLDTSFAVLDKASQIAKNLPTESKISNFNNQLLLNKANTLRSLYYQFKSKYQLTDEPETKQNALLKAQENFYLTLKIYKQLIADKESKTYIQAYLNQLSLLLEIEKWTNLTKESSQIITTEQSLQQLFKVLSTSKEKFQQLSPIESIYTRLNLAQSLTEINQNSKFKQLLFPQSSSLIVALDTAREALILSKELDNKRAESYALGTIGKIYDYLGQVTESKQCLETAIGLAQSVQAWDIAYQWQWELGRLYQQMGKADKAKEAYTAAINNLDKVRGNILAVSPEIQFKFKEKVEPVYQEYMELLLSQKNPNLKQVVSVQEKLKLSELETFLECGKLPVISLLDSQKLVDLPPTIYVIKLKNRIEVIVRTPEGNFYRHTKDFSLLSNSINSLLKGIQNKEITGIEESDLLIYSQALYNLLFAPIKKYLPKSGTLVFVLDSFFQNLPIAMLHDGNNYLIKRYNISTASSSELWQSQTLNPNKLKALIAGISEVSPSFQNPLVPRNFNALPKVKTEILNIKKNTTPDSKLLLNAKFTSEDFRQKMKDNPLTIVHLSTHGQFSSAPEKTFILAWDIPVTVKKLKLLLKTQRSGIDLLVLSACQTAKGDERSALGIAGIAVKAGARSTLASLWLVEADSTTKLMSEFYKGLRNGLTKAEALRLAQLKLMSDPKYSHPYFWAGFILVGNWL